jgi:excisionase family DNA binding protein
MPSSEPAFLLACRAYAKKAEQYAARALNSFLVFFPDELARKGYDDESYRLVLRKALAEQEKEYENLSGSFSRLPDSVFASPKVLGDYLPEYLTSFHADCPEVQRDELLADLPLASDLLRDLIKVYGLYKVRTYLKQCFQQTYGEWKAEYEARHQAAGSSGRRGERARTRASAPEAQAEGAAEVAVIENRPLGVKEAAAYLGLSAHAIYKLTSQRLIKHSKPSHKLYFVVADLDEWAAQNKVRTASEIQAEVMAQEWKQGKGKRR